MSGIDHVESPSYLLIKWNMHIVSHSLIGKAYLAVKGWLCKLKQILRFIKHVLHVGRAWKHDIPFSIFARYLRNLASTECRILSSVCPLFLLPKAYCSGLWYPWRWREGKKIGGVMQNGLLISHARHALTGATWHARQRTRDANDITFEPRRKSLVRKKSKSQSGFSWSSPSRQFLRRFRDASEESAHPTYSRQCRGANERRMRAASPRSKSGDWWWWMSSFHCREKY